MSCHSDLHPLYYSIEKYPGITRFILYTSNDPEMHRRLAKSVLLNLLKHTEEKHRKVVGHSSPLMHTRRVEDSSTGYFFAWRALLGGPSCIWPGVLPHRTSNNPEMQRRRIFSIDWCAKDTAVQIAHTQRQRCWPFCCPECFLMVGRSNRQNLQILHPHHRNLSLSQYMC